MEPAIARIRVAGLVPGYKTTLNKNRTRFGESQFLRSLSGATTGPAFHQSGFFFARKKAIHYLGASKPAAGLRQPKWGSVNQDMSGESLTHRDWLKAATEVPALQLSSEGITGAGPISVGKDADLAQLKIMARLLSCGLAPFKNRRKEPFG